MKSKTYKKIQNKKRKRNKTYKNKGHNIKSCIHKNIMKDEILRIHNITKKVKIHNNKTSQNNKNLTSS
jgi:hypothetical protein